MHLIRCNTAESLEALAPGTVLCHDVRDPAQPRTVVVRKGRRLDAADLARLRQLDLPELHLLVPEPGDLLALRDFGGRERGVRRARSFLQSASRARTLGEGGWFSRSRSGLRWR